MYMLKPQITLDSGWTYERINKNKWPGRSSVALLWLWLNAVQTHSLYTTVALVPFSQIRNAFDWMDWTSVKIQDEVTTLKWHIAINEWANTHKYATVRSYITSAQITSSVLFSEVCLLVNYVYVKFWAKTPNRFPS